LKIFISALLVCAISLAFLPCAFAAGYEPSNEIVEFIKEREGYRQYAYIDGGGVYIGYGMNCEYDEYPDGLTVEEADILLRQTLRSYADEVAAFANKYGLDLTQNQFDALLSFTYNIGGSWMRGGNRLFTYLTSGIWKYSDDEIVDAIGVWGHQGGVAVGGLITRRIAEARIFLYGDYTGKSSPEYCYLIVDRNGGTLENDIFCYRKGEAYGSLPQPVMDGSAFQGWVKSDGSVLSASDTVTKNMSVTASWGASGALGTGSAYGTFTDVPYGHAYSTAIEYCAANGIMNGVGDGRFNPSGSLSRAMLVTVIWRLAGSPVVSGDITFKDVAADMYYTEAVRWASATGIVNGYSADKFGTGDSITRQQLAAVLYRFASLQGISTETFGITADAFVDGADISAYASTPAVWSGCAGMLETFGGRFLPKDGATRAQAALALMVLNEMR